MCSPPECLPKKSDCPKSVTMSEVPPTAGTTTTGENRRYQVIEAVGKGGFGTVYRADLLSAGGFRKRVALKVLNPELADTPEFAHRLRDEARMLGLLHHRAIVRVDGLQQLNGRWTVVMEYVEGVDLKRVLSEGAMPVGPACEIVEEVAGALHSAFETPGHDGAPLRVLHRDLKPSNLQLTPNGEVKILDFGVAHAEFQQKESVTRSLFFGSLPYMSPERLDGIDAPSGDVYALGAILFELVMGEPLGRASGNRERHLAHIEAALLRLYERLPDEPFVQLVADCIAYDERVRPGARDLARRARVLRGRFPEPWLKDWAEETVPRLLAHREPLEDGLSGRILAEQSLVPDRVAPEDAAAPRSAATEARFVREAPDDDSTGSGSIAVERPSNAGVFAGIAAFTAVAVGVALLGVAVALFWVFYRAPAVEAVPVIDHVEAQEATGAEGGAGAEDPLDELLSDPQAAPSRPEEGPPTPSESNPPPPPPEAPDRAAIDSKRTPDTQRTTAAREVEGTKGEEEAEDAAPEGSLDAPPPVSTASAPSRVGVSGDADAVRLEGTAGSYQLPGMVSPGSYLIRATFAGETVNAGSVTVEADHPLTLSCRAGLRRCTAR